MILFYQICAARERRWCAANGLMQTEECGYRGVPKRDWILECAECVSEPSGGCGTVVDERAGGGCGADFARMGRGVCIAAAVSAKCLSP